MNRKSFAKTLDREGDRMRIVAPIGVVERGAVPFKLSLPQQLVKCELSVFRCYIAAEAERNKHLDKAVDVSVLSQEAPVEPADLIVLTVCIVIPSLAAPHLVAHQQHRGAE